MFMPAFSPQAFNGLAFEPLDEVLTATPMTLVSGAQTYSLADVSTDLGYRSLLIMLTGVAASGVSASWVAASGVSASYTSVKVGGVTATLVYSTTANRLPAAVYKVDLTPALPENLLVLVTATHALQSQVMTVLKTRNGPIDATFGDTTTVRIASTLTTPIEDSVKTYKKGAIIVLGATLSLTTYTFNGVFTDVAGILGYSVQVGGATHVRAIRDRVNFVSSYDDTNIFIQVRDNAASVETGAILSLKKIP